VPGAPWVGDGRAWQSRPVPPPVRSRAARAPGQAQPQALGTSLGTGTSLSRVHGQAEKGCGELVTGPAAASLGQGLMAPLD